MVCLGDVKARLKICSRSSGGRARRWDFGLVAKRAIWLVGDRLCSVLGAILTGDCERFWRDESGLMSCCLDG